MNDITICRIDNTNFKQAIFGIVHIFRDDDVVPWHKFDTCLEWVARRVERGFYITAAYDGDTIVGYSEWIETYDYGKRLLYLGLMHVDCDIRSRGIGSAMLADGEKYAISIGASHLRTIPGDEYSHNFYRRYGFVDMDTIHHISVPASSKEISYDETAPLTLHIVDTHNFIFGMTQSSGRHMYECANYQPESSGSLAKTMVMQDGYLQFNYARGTKTAWVLYWSNTIPTEQTVATIRALGREAGFEEIRFSFRARFNHLFDKCPRIIDQEMKEEDVELEKVIYSRSI